jgi:hypothetical protein
MKASLLALGFLLTGLSAFAANVTLTDGRTFHDATIVSQTPRKVVIKHTDGLSGVEKTLLPAELSARYPIDEAAARKAEHQAAEARLRAEQFHKAEAERAAAIRLAREQTALHNAQVAALEASQRLAEAEAARVAAQRTEVVYEYVSFNRSYPRYIYTPRRADDCEPRWNDRPRDDRHVHNNHSPRHERNIDDSDRRSPRQHVTHTPTSHRTHKSPAVPSAVETRSTEEEKTPAKVGAAVARR